MLNVLLIIGILFHTSTQGFDYPGIYQITEPVDHAEGPTWDSRTNSLYFVDIHSGHVLRWSYATGATTKLHLPGQITPVIPSRTSPTRFYAGLNRSVVAFDWDGLSAAPSAPPVTLTTVSPQFPTSRFNDGKADSRGRLWIGTMGYESATGGLTPDEGVLYKVTCANRNAPEVVFAPLNISNGLAWSRRNDRIFHIDTPTGRVMEYEFEEEVGRLGAGRVAFDVEENADRVTGSPDGMTIDEEDSLWVALYGGGAVVKVGEGGRVEQVVALPARDVTSAMWGGPALDVLFVTTSRFTLSEEEKLRYPEAGAVFAVVGLKTKGLEVFGADFDDCID